MTRRKTHEEFVVEVEALVGEEFTVLGTYKTAADKIAIKHSCGYVNDVRPRDFLRGTRCPKCSRKAKKDTSVFKKEVRDLVGSEYTVDGKYVNANTKIEMRHNTCGTLYEVKPSMFLYGVRCPCCKASKGERAVKDTLDSLNVAYIHQKRFIDNGRRTYDFYLPTLNVCIEYDGEFHYKEIRNIGSRHTLSMQQRSDNIKNVYCMLNDIPLLRIPYWDYGRIPELVTQFINELQTKKEAA